MLLFVVGSSYAMDIPKVQCPNCHGIGSVVTGYYYGQPITNQCALCGGYGFLVVIEQAVSFQGGHFLKTNRTVSVYHESGHYKGAYNVYLHNGYIYILFGDNYINIQGKSRFPYNGTWYVIK